jgi:peroxiredoxin
MKNIHRKIIFAVLILGFAVFGIFAVYKIINKNKQTSKIEQIPQFVFKTEQGNPFTPDSMNIRADKIIIHYNSECEFCQNEIHEIIQNAEKFGNIQFLLVSCQKPYKTKDFIKKLNLTNCKTIKFAYSNDKSFFEYFGTTSVPCTFIFNTSGKLINHFNGEVNAEFLLKCIAEIH